MTQDQEPFFVEAITVITAPALTTLNFKGHL